MLFHAIMTHSEDNCPVYDSDRMHAMIESFENLEALGVELDVKHHFFTWCAPAHTAFVLLEAGSLSAVSRYLFSIPIKQHIDIAPVEHLEDTVAMARAAAARGKM